MHKLAARAGLFLVSSVTALLLGEMLVRVTGMGPEVFRMPERFIRFSDDPVLRYEHVPNMKHGQYATNVNGLRGRPFEKNKPDRAYRIAVVGDSVSFGWDVGEGEAWPDVLQRLLDAHALSEGLAFQVLNFAVTGYNATQIAEMVHRRVREWEPDLILYGYCLNDPQEYSIEFEELLDRLSERERKWVRHASYRVLGRSRLLQLAALSLRRNRHAPAGGRRTTWRDDPQFQALQSGQGADYFLGLHRTPASFGRVEDAMARMAGKTPVVVCLFPLFTELENPELLDVHAQVEAAARKHGLDFEDLTADFVRARRDGVIVNGDQLHPSSAGHEVAANRIVGIVERYCQPPHGPERP